MTAPPELMTVSEAAEYLGLSARWVRRAIFEGRIEYVKLGRLVRIPRAALDDLVERGRRPRASDRLADLFGRVPGAIAPGR